MRQKIIFTFVTVLLNTWCLFYGPAHAQLADPETDETPEPQAKIPVPPGAKIRALSTGKEEPYRAPRRISRKLSEGEFLIYDCKERHFACVDEAAFTRCREARDLGLALKKEKILSCAPLKNYKNYNECTKQQYSVQHRRKNKSFCLVELGAESI